MSLASPPSALLQGKVVVVTGGSSGIGRATALTCARHGAAAVVLGDLGESPREGGETTETLLRAMSVPCAFVRADVTDRGDVEALVAAAEPWGGVDLMVCNAGIALAADGTDISAADFAKLIAVNLQGALTCAQAAANAMLRRAAPGSIVLVSSMGGLRGAARTTGYGATKGGLNMLAASLADGWGPNGIRVNTVCPGLIDTDLAKSSPQVEAAVEGLRQRMPLRRLGSPDEVGQVIAWLGSDYATYITGTAIPVDGGMTAVL